MNPQHSERFGVARNSRLAERPMLDDDDEPAPESSERPAPYTERGGPTGEPWPARSPLFTTDEAAALTDRWNAIQAGFIESPKMAAEQADELVSEALQRLVQMFTDERVEIHRLLERGAGEAARSTEELRLALRRYRSLLGRLLAY